MKLTVSPLAEQDIEAIGDYIAQDNPGRAMGFTEELYQQCNLTGENPWLYRERTELGYSIRSCTYGRYVFIYTALDHRARIERVVHGSRDIEGLLPWLPDGE